VPLHDLTLEQARALLQRGEINSVELTQALLDRIAVKDKEISAYLTVTAEGAIAAARQADARRVAGEETPLLGIPIDRDPPPPGGRSSLAGQDQH